MAWKGLSTTAFVFDDSNTEQNCMNFINAFDKGKKQMLIVMTNLVYPEYFIPGNKLEDCPSLVEKVKELYEPFVITKSESTVFFGWNKDYEDQKKMYFLLNKELQGGAKKFIIEILTTLIPTLANNSISYSPYSKEVLSSLSHSLEKERQEKEEKPMTSKVVETSPINKEITPSPAPAQAQPKPVQETQELDDEEKALLELANDFTTAMDGSTKVNDNASTDSTSDTYTDELGFRFKKKG